MGLFERGEKIEVILERWGRTRRMNDPYHLDYPHQTPFARQVTTSWSNKPPPLDDEKHLGLDSIISELKNRKPLHHEVITRYYVAEERESTMAKIKLAGKRHSSYELRQVRKNAEGWIESRLDL